MRASCKQMYFVLGPQPFPAILQTTIHQYINKRSRREVLYRKTFLKNFTTFQRKRHVMYPISVLLMESIVGVSQLTLRNFSEHLFQ